MLHRMTLIAVAFLGLPVAIGARNASTAEVGNRQEESRPAQANTQVDLSKPANSPQNIEAAEKEFKARFNEFVADKTTADLVLVSQMKLRVARLAAAGSKEEKVAVLEGSLRSARDIWAICKARFEAGHNVITQYAQTRSAYEETRAMLNDLRKQ